MDSIVKSDIFVYPDSESTPAEPTKTTPAGSTQKKRRVTVDPKPVIRIVFALASPEPAVVFKTRPEKQHHFDKFTTFDIWLAGLSNKTYRQVEDGDLVHYQTLLERSLAPHDAFELQDVPHIGEEAKKSRGARRRKMVPLAFPEHAHHSIHRVKDLENPGEGSGGQPGVRPAPADPQSRAPATTTAGPSTTTNKKNRRR
jgi:hypothetical protein